MKLINNPYWKRVLKGHLFKGHAFQLTTSIEGGSEIEIHQNYYNFSVRQVYRAKSDTTISTMTYGLFPTRTPNWYLKLLDNLMQKDVMTKFICKNEKYTMFFNHTWVYLEYTTQFEGSYFTNHYENIKAKKEMHCIAKSLMIKFKKLDIIDFTTFLERTMLHDEHAKIKSNYIIIPSSFLE